MKFGQEYFDQYKDWKENELLTKLPSQIISTLTIVLLPIFSVTYLYMNKNKLVDPDFNIKFGTLYLNLNLQKASAYLSTMFFTTRRIVLGITTVLYSDYLILIFVVYIYSSIMQLCFYLHFLPFDSFVKNLLEIINEVLILMSAYYIIMFSDYVEI